MGFPSLQTCPTCNSSFNSCSCSKTAQGTTPIQSLPKPTAPCNNEAVPAEYYSSDHILWAGADNDVLGIKNGDTLTKVLNIIMQNI